MGTQIAPLGTIGVNFIGQSEVFQTFFVGGGPILIAQQTGRYTFHLESYYTVIEPPANINLPLDPYVVGNYYGITSYRTNFGPVTIFGNNRNRMIPTFDDGSGNYVLGSMNQNVPVNLNAGDVWELFVTNQVFTARTNTPQAEILWQGTVRRDP